MHRYHTYKGRSLAALLETQAAPNHHVATLTEKNLLNIFEAAMKI